ncbi:exonuclease domain-containing protein [Rhodoluna lacicola]|jgi:DNA polymerase-3 subunit epsilon|uniref:DNA polymerase III, epsilon subunit-related 3'-5' exonuclease n=1 Tax=Rhodoluna lacicola TaxID=529884 RepID=A0A060JFW3_9MICO|nr:exonuclease domain-containing protein [Rhodoluna lacicola]AIC47610.1 DNA polymerase III, epsilon subunit-related 3'-5' exonuclease [Rhodoluna lacicola]
MNDQLSFDFNTTMPEWAKQIAVFDLETTGLDLTDARIVTACAVELDASGNVVGTNSEWLANPGIEIPTQASDVHGVTTEIAVREGRPADVVIAELLATLRDFFARGLPVVAYNAPYDFTILHYEALRHGLEPLKLGSVIDPLVIDKFKDKYRKGKRRLENAAEFYQVPLEDAHNATADAVAAGRVAQAIAKRWADELPATAGELHDAQIRWSEAIDADFESYMRRSVNPDFTATRGWPLKLA